jgi:hypothetical protein
MEGLLESRQRSPRVPGVMSENLPLTLFIVFSVAIYLINAFYLLRWARMPGDDDARRRRYLLSVVALIVYAVFMYFLVKVAATII